VSNSLALGVSRYLEGFRAIQERASRAGIGQQKQNQRSGDWLVILILHLHDGLVRGSQFDVVQRSLAVEDDDLKRFGRSRILTISHQAIAAGKQGAE
jgi:hypothetical protein